MKADDRGPRRRPRALENAAEKHGDRFAPPTILKRLVAQGRLGQKSGQGFYAYPQPDEGDKTRRPVSSSRPAATSRSRGSANRR
jgi:3-hydroxyacyl-CoA dehydrogenase